MPVSLLFARSFATAEIVVLTSWKWELSGEMHFEFRRPDTGERVRFVHDDGGGTLRNLCWNTRVYLADDWMRRRDAPRIRELLRLGFFVEIDPTLPPPRSRRSRNDRIDEIEQQLKALKQ